MVEPVLSALTILAGYVAVMSLVLLTVGAFLKPPPVPRFSAVCGSNSMVVVRIGLAAAIVLFPKWK